MPTVLKGYFDGSWTHPSGVTLIAGHVATEQDWKNFEELWRRELDYWRLEKLHLAELERQLGHENGTLCKRAFARLIHSDGRGLHGVLVGINDDDWDEYRQSNPDAQRVYPRRYDAVADMLFRNLGQLSQLRGNDVRLDVTMDQDREPVSFVESMFQQWKDRYPDHLGTIQFSRSSECIPLQVADLLAGLNQRDWFKHGFTFERDTPFPNFDSIDARAALWAAGTSSDVGWWSAKTAEKVEVARKEVAARKK